MPEASTSPAAPLPHILQRILDRRDVQFERGDALEGALAGQAARLGGGGQELLLLVAQQLRESFEFFPHVYPLIPVAV